MRELSRPWVSSIENATVRPRHRFGVDGRLIAYVMAPMCVCGLFSRFPIQLYWYGGAFVFFIIARAVQQIKPWLIDDACDEQDTRKWYIDVPHGDSLGA